MKSVKGLGEAPQVLPLSVPRFSLLMPSFNAETYIDEAITSALQALGPADELIVQDGASRDSTSEIVTRRAQLDDRILFNSAPDDGQSDALNKALARAGGDYIGWLNADDVVAGEGLAAIREALHSSDRPTIAFGDHRIVRASGETIRRYRTRPLDRAQLMARGCYVFSGSLFVKAETLRRIGGFSPEHSYCMDLDLMLTLVERSDFTQMQVPVVVGSMRWHDASKSGGQPWRFVSDAWRVRREHRRASSDLLMAVYATLVLTASIVTTKIRHSDVYLQLRGDEKSC